MTLYGHPGSLIKQMVWPEQVAYNCLLNWVFLWEKMLSVAFSGVKVMVTGDWGFTMYRGGKG